MQVAVTDNSTGESAVGKVDEWFRCICCATTDMIYLEFFSIEIREGPIR